MKPPVSNLNLDRNKPCSNGAVRYFRQAMRKFWHGISGGLDQLCMLEGFPSDATDVAGGSGSLCIVIDAVDGKFSGGGSVVFSSVVGGGEDKGTDPDVDETVGVGIRVVFESSPPLFFSLGLSCLCFLHIC